MIDDPYEILQVSRNAEPEVIEAAYRRLARKYHPDINNESYSSDRMLRINWAYDILSDPIRRSRYDRQINNPYTSYSAPEKYQESNITDEYEPKEKSVNNKESKANQKKWYNKFGFI